MKNTDFSILYSYEFISTQKKMSRELQDEIKYFIDGTYKECADEIFDTLKSLYAGVELDSTMYKLIYKILDREYLNINDDNDLDFYIYPDSVTIFHRFDGKIYTSKSDSVLGDYSYVYRNMNLDALKEAVEVMEEHDESVHGDLDNIDLIMINNLIFEKGVPICILQQKK